MRDQGTGNGQPLIVALPPVIDTSDATDAYDQLHAALESGVPAVIADFTATVYCDAAGVHGLLLLRDRATVRDVRFRGVIPAGDRAIPRGWQRRRTPASAGR